MLIIIQKVLMRARRSFVPPQDPLFAQQWYLQNSSYDTINQFPVWEQGVTGRNVVITAVDDGIEYTHPDLAPNYRPAASYDYNGLNRDYGEMLCLFAHR